MSVDLEQQNGAETQSIPSAMCGGLTAHAIVAILFAGARSGQFRSWVTAFAVETAALPSGRSRGRIDVRSDLRRHDRAARSHYRRRLCAGPNGAGKTSTITAIMGHVDIYPGRIDFDGADITRSRTSRTSRSRDCACAGRPPIVFRPHCGRKSHGRRLCAGVGRRRRQRDRVFGYFPRLYERRR